MMIKSEKTTTPLALSAQRLSVDESGGGGSSKEKSKSLVAISPANNNNSNITSNKNNSNSDELMASSSKDVVKKKKDKRVTLKSTENLPQHQSMSKLNHKSHSNLSTDVLSTATTTSTGLTTDPATANNSSSSSRFFNYSTVVLAGSFISYMLASLLSSCFGVFFENMESDLGWSKSKVAFIGGLISALQDLSGPISSALTNEYGCRKTAFIGGLIAGLGMIGSAYAEDFWLLGFLMGGVSGFGSSLVLVSSVVVVTYYFEEKPSFAAGLTISGGSLGQSIFSLIIIQLNEYYGRSGCFLILGGILLNMCVCACLFRPLKWELEGEEEDDDDDDEDDEDDDDDEDEEDDDDEEDDEDDEEESSSLDGDESNVKSSPKSLANSQSHTSCSDKESKQKSVPSRAIMDSVSYLNEIGSSSSRNRLVDDGRSIRSQGFVINEDAQMQNDIVDDSRPPNDENNNNNDDDDDEIYENRRIRSIFLDFDDLDNRNGSNRQPNSSLASTISLKSVEQLLNAGDDGDQLFVVSGPKQFRPPDLARFHSLEFNKNKMMLSLSNGNIVDDGGVPSAVREIEAQRKCNSMIVMPMMMNNEDSIHFYRSVGVSPTPNHDDVDGQVVDANGSTILLESRTNKEPMGDDKEYQDENQNEYVIVDADDMDNSNLILSSSRDDIYLRMMSDKSKKSEPTAVDDETAADDKNDKEPEEEKDGGVASEKPPAPAPAAGISKKESKPKKQRRTRHNHHQTSSNEQNDADHSLAYSSKDGAVTRLKMESSMDQNSSCDESGVNAKKQSFLSLLVNKLKRSKQKSPTPNTVNSSSANSAIIGGSKKFKEPVAAGGTVAATTSVGQTQLAITTAKPNLSMIPSNKSLIPTGSQVANSSNLSTTNNTTNARAKRYYIAKCSCSKKQQLQLQSKGSGNHQNTIGVPGAAGSSSVAGTSGGGGSFKTGGATTTTKFRHLPSCPLYYLKRIQQTGGVAGQQPTGGNNRQYYVIRRGQNPVFGAGPNMGFVQQLPLASTNQAFYPSGPSSGHMPIYLQQKHSFPHKSPATATGAVNPQYHHYHKANLYRVPSLFQDSYKVPLHFRNVYYYKSLLNLNMRLMVLRPHGAGALTIVHKTNPSQQQQQQQSLDPSTHHHHHHHQHARRVVDSNNISISCPDLQPKQVLVVKKADKMSQQQQQIGQATTSIDAINQSNNGPSTNSTSTPITAPTTSSSSNNNNVRVLYPVLTIKELKQLKQHAHQYTTNMNRLKFKQQAQHHHHHQSDAPMGTNNSELKSFSGAQVLNVGSILLRSSESSSAAEKPTGSGLVRASRKDSVRLSALLSDKKTGKELTTGGGKEVVGGVTLNKAKNADELRKLIPKKSTSGSKKKTKTKKTEDDEAMISLSGYQDKIGDGKSKEDEDDDEEDDEDDEDEDEEEDDDDDDLSEDEDDEGDESDEEEEDCDNCFTRTKVGNLIYKYIYKPVVRPVKFIYYSTVENIKLFRLFRFCLFALCNFILSFFYEAPFYFINSYMVESGSTPNQAGTITVAVGIVSVFSSIVYGYIGDSKRVNPIILYSISLLLCGLCCVAIPFFITSYPVTMVLMILIGALISVSDVLVPIICVNIVGYDDFVNAYGLMFFCQGLASFSGPPVLGLIVDGSGTYHLSYYLIGAGICTSGLVISLILVYDKVKARAAAAVKNATGKDLPAIEAAAAASTTTTTSNLKLTDRSQLKKLVEEEESG